MSESNWAREGFPAELLRGIRRGIEKESLRSLRSGALAATPHPKATSTLKPRRTLLTLFSM